VRSRRSSNFNSYWDISAIADVAGKPGDQQVHQHRAEQSFWGDVTGLRSSPSPQSTQKVNDEDDQ
jgi:hypothetical protein